MHRVGTVTTPTLFLGGRWSRSRGGRSRRVHNPFDQNVIAVVDEANAEDAAEAVAAARGAFDDGPWSSWTAARRADLLRRIAFLVDRDRSDLARWETLNTGKRLAECEADVDDAAAVFRYYASLVETGNDRLVDTGVSGILSRVVHEPVGVCALITAWECPLVQVSWKAAPALAAGNTLVLKPSELTPMTTVRLTRLLVEAGAPPGVVNLVTGTGTEAGAELVDSPDVDLVSLTGGVATGTAVMRAAAGTVKRLLLELGGKNPNIVFADADLPAAVRAALNAAFGHAGQACSASTRLIVHDRVYEEFVERFVAGTRAIRLGSGLDPTAGCGPLLDAGHLQRVEEAVELGRSCGAKLLTGGQRPQDPVLARGFFHEPTVFGDCDAWMDIVREETLGPIVTVERFASEKEAVELGNDTNYGLAAAVWTADRSRAERVATRLRHGTVWINDYGTYVPQAEWGGYKSSGTGRELGPSGLAAYQELKHIMEGTGTPAR